MDWIYVLIYSRQTIIEVRRQVLTMTSRKYDGNIWLWHGHGLELVLQKSSPFGIRAIEVYAPTLTAWLSAPPSFHPRSDWIHISRYRRLLEEKNLHGVILVGHSYAGWSSLAWLIRCRAHAHLVYLDTLCTDWRVDGQCIDHRQNGCSAKSTGLWGWLEIALKAPTGDYQSRSQLGALEGDTPVPEDVEQPLHLKNPGAVSETPDAHTAPAGAVVHSVHSCDAFCEANGSGMASAGSTN